MLFRSNAPSEYTRRFARHNDEIVETMKSHLIGDFKEFGIQDDDYEKFLSKRTKWLLREITKRVPAALATSAAAGE